MYVPMNSKKQTPVQSSLFHFTLLFFSLFPIKQKSDPPRNSFTHFLQFFLLINKFSTANKDIKSGNDPRMQLRKQNANAPGLDSQRSSLNVFSCFFNRLFNELFILLWGSFPLFITIYGKHFLLVFFLSLLTINFCLHVSEDLRIKGGAVQTHFTVFIIITITIRTSLPTLFFIHRIDKEHPTTVISKISVQRSTCCLEFYFVWGQLKMSKIFGF